MLNARPDDKATLIQWDTLTGKNWHLAFSEPPGGTKVPFIFNISTFNLHLQVDIVFAGEVIPSKLINPWSDFRTGWFKWLLVEVEFFNLSWFARVVGGSASTDVSHWTFRIHTDHTMQPKFLCFYTTLWSSRSSSAKGDPMSSYLRGIF